MVYLLVAFSLGGSSGQPAHVLEEAQANQHMYWWVACVALLCTQRHQTSVLTSACYTANCAGGVYGLCLTVICRWIQSTVATHHCCRAKGPTRD